MKLSRKPALLNGQSNCNSFSHARTVESATLSKIVNRAARAVRILEMSSARGNNISDLTQRP